MRTPIQVLLSFYVLLYRTAIAQAKGEIFKARRCGTTKDGRPKHRR